MCSSVSHAILPSLCLSVGGVGDVCSSVSHAILPSLCLSNIDEVWVMCVPLSVMQYCHHSALVRGVGDVCSSVSHAILPSLCLSVRCG